MKNLKNLLLLTLFSTLLFACSKKDEDPKDPKDPNENELITTVELKFTPVAGGEAKVFYFKDLDGPGGNAPVIDDIVLDSTTSYTLAIRVLDESNAADVDDITLEILEEADEHQFFFGGTAIQNGYIAITYSDEDANGKPLGLLNQANTFSPGSGTFTVILLHELNKNGAGVSDGDPTNAGGETDIEISFNLTVE